MISDNNAHFITTEPLQGYGITGESLVWDKIQLAFQQRSCIAYWRYPLFSPVGKFRKEPDILILDQQWGMILIEVKSITLEQIISIRGHGWQVKNFYRSHIYPYQQAEGQLLTLLDYFRNEPSLDQKVSAKVIIALPLISQAEWEQSQFAKLPSIPPLIFKENLDHSDLLLTTIDQQPFVKKGQVLNAQQWNLVLSLVGGSPVYCQENHRVLSHSRSRGKILQKLRSHLSQLDLELEKIAKQIPNGCQRIRGIAGSGKTIILCQKAAIMHLKHPHWKIALIFFSRSLYQTITQQVDQWLRYYSQDQVTYSQDNKNLLILHAWGAKDQKGFYQSLCELTRTYPLSVNETDRQSPIESLGEVCVNLLNKTVIPQIFDAILIDEAQDLMVNRWLWQGKQPFFYLAYQALKPCNSLDPKQKRLIWAYDELQSLDTLKPLTASQLLGEELGHLVTGNYPYDIPKTQTLNRCYRTPSPIVMAAYGLGMGLLRPQGMITGMTDKKEWETLGFQIKGELINGHQITLTRSPDQDPNPIIQWWQDPLIEFNTYQTRKQELFALSKQIKQNLRQDGLRPSQEILVIVLGDYFKSIQLQAYAAKYLTRQGIDIYIPTAKSCNVIPQLSVNHNQFWQEGAVTLSRIYRSKGNQAAMVYLIGLDHLAESEADIQLRNQLFIALTRSQAWVKMSGIGSYPFYQEVRQVLPSLEQFTLIYQPPLKRKLYIKAIHELLNRYATGERNFQGIDLSYANLERVNLSKANLIQANLSHCHLRNAQLNQTKLIAADLSYADLSGASLRNAKLMGANLTGSILDKTDLRYADLTDTIQ